jgi:hypothetical protein
MMRRRSWRRYRHTAASVDTVRIAALWLGLSATGCAPAISADCTPTTACERFAISFLAGKHDPAGQFAGGTELRLLTAHAGRLYAGNGYWEDQPGWEGRQGAQVLALDAPGAVWRVDHVFDDRLPSSRPRDLAVSALAEVTLTTDGNGRALPHLVSLLIASTWDLSGASRVFTRDDGTGDWRATTLAQDQPTAGFLPQIRAFGVHRDRVTGVDLVFAGQTPRGVFSGHYDDGVPGLIRWDPEPEFGVGSVSTAAPGLQGRLRISSFAEANGRLYAAIGQQIFERVDGPAPRWKLVYTNPTPGLSETGLRGLTAVPAGDGRQALLAAVEGSAARLARIDPDSGSEVTELDILSFLEKAWGMRPGYVIAAYNDMTPVEIPARGRALLVGLMAFIRKDSPTGPGHTLVDVGYGRVEGNAWFLVRWRDGTFDLHRVTAAFPQHPVAVRTIVLSPFAREADTIYFGGFDANKAPAHNTAWIARGSLSDLLSKAH